MKLGLFNALADLTVVVSKLDQRATIAAQRPSSDLRRIRSARDRRAACLKARVCV
jgi:hypothetical protein